MRGKRIDANQPEAVTYLRSAGYSVFITATVGGGFPDLVCTHTEDRWFTALVEIKDGKRPPSARKLTVPEQAFHNIWPGTCITALSGEDAWKRLELARMKWRRQLTEERPSPPRVRKVIFCRSISQQEA